jgi:DNA-binding MarR family transcriptional regulator
MSRRPTLKHSVVQDSHGQVFILTKKQKEILTFAAEHPGCTYQECSDRTLVPVNTLMVYAQRLDLAKLLERKPKLIDSRVRTVLRLRDGVCLDFDVRRV